MAIFNREKMIAERIAMERRLLAEMTEAQKRCRNRFENEQCVNAYCDLMNQEADRICQSYGGLAAIFYMPKVKP